LQKGARDPELYSVGLPSNAAAGNIGDDGKAAGSLAGDQRLASAGALGLGYEILVKRTTVDFEVSGARTKKYARSPTCGDRFRNIGLDQPFSYQLSAVSFQLTPGAA